MTKKEQMYLEFIELYLEEIILIRGLVKHAFYQDGSHYSTSDTYAISAIQTLLNLESAMQYVLSIKIEKKKTKKKAKKK